jgi:hypothetical protein
MFLIFSLASAIGSGVLSNGKIRSRPWNEVCDGFAKDVQIGYGCVAYVRGMFDEATF